MIHNLLIVGLGNPGAKYNKTRHNLGATWVSNVCCLYQVQLKNNPKLLASVANISDLNLVCMIPNDYMNNSGNSVKLAAKFYNFSPEKILVIHDELDLPAGVIRLKISGGHGGHNGLRDLIQQLNSNQFKRLRIGIGRPKSSEPINEYVLSPASYAEQILIEKATAKSLNILPEIAKLNWSEAMQLLHTDQNIGEINEF